MSSESVKPISTTYQLIGPTEDGMTGDLLDGMCAGASRQRLQALLSEWLRMENLVVLAGAGTSVSAGGQTMDALERSILQTLKKVSGLPKTLDLTIDTRLASETTCQRGRRPRFEEWLSYLVNGYFIGSMVDSPFSGVTWKSETVQPSQEELRWFIRWVQKAIFAECALSLPDAGSGDERPLAGVPHLSFLGKLVARDSNLGRTHLFTLNYDTLFEQAADALGIQYFDGFSGRADAHFDPSVYGLDVYYPGEVSEGRVRRFDRFLHLYKLHGSIHWRLEREELKARHPDLAATDDYRSLDAEAKARRLHEGAVPEATGILPTANKFVQTLTMPYAHLFRALQSRLAIPQTFLLVLGYGFGDDHVTRLIEVGLTNPSLVMLVVEPDPGSKVVSRVRQYRDLGKRAFILTATRDAHHEAPFTYATYDDFAQAVIPDVQWLTDLQRLRRFEKQIQPSNTSLDFDDAGWGERNG